MIILKYVGSGGLISVPARDLTQEDLTEIAWTGHTIDTLIKTGLYTLAEEEKPVVKSKKEVKNGN